MPKQKNPPMFPTQSTVPAEKPNLQFAPTSQEAFIKSPLPTYTQATAPQIEQPLKFTQESTASKMENSVENQTTCMAQGLEQLKNIDVVTIKENGETFEIDLYKDAVRTPHVKLITTPSKQRFMRKLQRYATLGYYNKDIDIDVKVNAGAKPTILNIRRKCVDKENDLGTENVFTVRNIRQNQVIGFIKPLNGRQLYIQDSSHNSIYKMTCKGTFRSCSLPGREHPKFCDKQIYPIREVDMEKNKAPRQVKATVKRDGSVGNTLQFNAGIDGFDSDVAMRALAVCAEITFFLD